MTTLTTTERRTRFSKQQEISNEGPTKEEDFEMRRLRHTMGCWLYVRYTPFLVNDCCRRELREWVQQYRQRDWEKRKRSVIALGFGSLAAPLKLRNRPVLCCDMPRNGRHVVGLDLDTTSWVSKHGRFATREGSIERIAHKHSRIPVGMLFFGVFSSYSSNKPWQLKVISLQHNEAHGGIQMHLKYWLLWSERTTLWLDDLQ